MSGKGLNDCYIAAARDKIMSQNRFVLKSVLWGIILGLAVVTGLFFSPHILALLHPPVPEAADRITAVKDKVKAVRLPVPKEKKDASLVVSPDIKEEESAPFTGDVPAIDLKRVARAEQDAKEEMPRVETTTDTIKPYYAGEESLWKGLAGKDLDPEFIKGYPYSECFRMAASRNDLPLAFILGLADYLSNFEAGSSMDDMAGIMRLGWPNPAKRLGVSKKEDLFQDPCQGIMIGAGFLSDLLSKSGGEWVPALVAYRDQVRVVHPEKINGSDLLFCSRVRERVEHVLKMPFEEKIMYAFWKFDERTTAQNFIIKIKEQSGVDLLLGQEGHGYVVYIPAANEVKMKEKAGLIRRETGIVGLKGATL